MRGVKGILGDKSAINFSKLLISLASPTGSSPSLTTKINDLALCSGMHDYVTVA
jgi:hypothetical protein